MLLESVNTPLIMKVGIESLQSHISNQKPAETFLKFKTTTVNHCLVVTLVVLIRLIGFI